MQNERQPDKEGSMKQKRQKKGEGTFVHRADGTVEFRISLGKRVDGTRFRPSFYGKTESEAWQAYLDWEKQSEVEAPVERIKTVKAWALEWLETYLGSKKQSSYKNYKNYELYVTKHIIPAIGHLNITDVRPLHIKKLLNSKEDLSKSALKYIEICLKGIFAKAIENHLLEAKNNPVNPEDFLSKTKLKKKPLSFSNQEVYKIEAFAPKHEFGEITMALLHTGVRAGELAALMPEDIHADDGYISVNKTVVEVKNDDESTYIVGGKEKHHKKYDIKYTTKNNEDRKVALNENGAEFFKNLQNRKSKYVFPPEVGEFMTANGLRYRYNKFLKALNKDLDRQKAEYLQENPEATEEDLEQFENVRYLSPHKCRHTYGSRTIASGIDVRIIQEQLGHKQITTTQIYTDNQIEDRKKIISKFKY